MSTSIMRPEASALTHGGGDLDVQISTAKAYPRDVVACVNEIGALATLDEETAASCMFFVPRAGTYIEGYSIRFAEVCMASWGNIRVASRCLDRKGDTVEAEAVCWDLEKNVARMKTCKRRVVFKGGEELAEAAAQSVASRDAILSVIPQGIVRKVREQIRQKVLGRASDMADLRQRIVGGFAEHGVTEQHLARWIGPDAKGRAKEAKTWTSDDLFALRTLLANVRNGERSIKAEFGVQDKRAPKGKVTSPEADEVQRRAEAKLARGAPARPAPASGTRETEAGPLGATRPQPQQDGEGEPGPAGDSDPAVPRQPPPEEVSQASEGGSSLDKPALLEALERELYALDDGPYVELVKRHGLPDGKASTLQKQEEALLSSLLNDAREISGGQA